VLQLSPSNRDALYAGIRKGWTFSGDVRYSRGRITVLDRPGLEARACECYEVVKRECDRLLPDTLAT
jgi:hypothetical protein